jgi:hypothetical protein
MTLGGYPPQGSPPSGGPPPPSADKNKLNTLFVGAIPAGVQDEWIDQLLKVRNKKLSSIIILQHDPFSLLTFFFIFFI